MQIPSKITKNNSQGAAPGSSVPVPTFTRLRLFVPKGRAGLVRMYRTRLEVWLSLAFLQWHSSTGPLRTEQLVSSFEVRQPMFCCGLDEKIQGGHIRIETSFNLMTVKEQLNLHILWDQWDWRVPVGPPQNLKQSVILPPELQWEAWWTRNLAVDECFVTRKVRHCKRRCKMENMVEYDPAKYEKMNGHCFYACAYFTLTGRVPHSRDIVGIRRTTAAAWKAVPDQLCEQERVESIEKGEYLKKFVYSGWGGLPEAGQLDRIQPLNVRVVDIEGRTLWTSSLMDVNHKVWCYTGSHYSILHCQVGDVC